MCAIAFMMEVAEVDETMSGVLIQAQPGKLHPLRLNRAGIGGNSKRRCQQCGGDKFAPAEFHFMNPVTLYAGITNTASGLHRGHCGMWIADCGLRIAELNSEDAKTQSF